MSPPSDVSHLAVILDGNGRWAAERGLLRAKGHEAGVEAAIALVRNTAERGIPWLTLFCFSTENWQRPHDEVDTLLRILSQEAKAEQFVKEGVRVLIMGDRTSFSAKLQRQLTDLEEATADQQRVNLILALNHGGRNDIVRATNLILTTTPAQEVNEEQFQEKLWQVALPAAVPPPPNPDLVIRTGREVRLSNFMLWQLAYSEFVFLDRLWPDFDATDLDEALQIYHSRTRRFGKI